MKGVREGSGTLYYPSGEVYSGDIAVGVQTSLECYHLSVCLQLHTISLKMIHAKMPAGQWHLNKRHGLGAMTYKSGDKYEGHWHLDMRHGQAQYVTQAGDVFDGMYKNDVRDGPGTVAKVTLGRPRFD